MSNSQFPWRLLYFKSTCHLNKIQHENKQNKQKKIINKLELQILN